MRSTNNIAELTAIKLALELLNELEQNDLLSVGRKIHIFTDSQYCNGLLMKGWVAKKNQDLVAEIRV